jgi:hypothetical protein
VRCVRKIRGGAISEPFRHWGLSSIRPNDAGDKLDGGQELPGDLFIAGSDRTEPLDVGEEILDQMALSIKLSAVWAGALSAQTEGRVQPAAVHRDESFDRAIGIAPGDHGEDREQQDVGQLIQLPFGPARSGISPSKPINSSNDRKATAWLIGCRA